MMLLIILSPLFLVISIIILIDDGSIIIFRQKRVGKIDKLFTMYKFRTMLKSTKDIPTHLLKESEKCYTRSGKFLRKYSLDELPQLLNILNSANVACGYHADDEATMDMVIKISKQIVVSIGAKPSFNDPEKFGRKRRLGTQYCFYWNRSRLKGQCEADCFFSS